MQWALISSFLIKIHNLTSHKMCFLCLQTQHTQKGEYIRLRSPISCCVKMVTIYLTFVEKYTRLGLGLPGCIKVKIMYILYER